MAPTLENDVWIKSVLGPYTNVNIKQNYGIDASQYEWVKDYIRDKKLRDENKRLQKDITAIRTAPTHKDEVVSMLKDGLKSIRQSVVEQLKIHILEVQQREAALFHGLDIKVLQILALNLLSTSEINEILSVLETGKKKQKIEESVKNLINEIANNKKIINEELSPQHRWLHHSSGHPVLYPNGCRWTIFVNDWKKVVSYFEDHVDIEGYALETEHEHAAFRMLSLDKVYKPSAYLKESRKK